MTPEPPRTDDADALAPVVYDELRRLQATALVHEAYLRLGGAGTPCVADQGVDRDALLCADGFILSRTCALPAVLSLALGLGIMPAPVLLEPATTAAAFGEDS